MACTDMDPRKGGTVSNIFAKKFTCVVVGMLQVVFWTLGLLTLIFKPSSAGAIIEKLDTKAQVITGLVLAASIVFCALLVVGVFKDSKCFVFTYLVYVVVYITLLVLALIINIFTQPQIVGLRGFFSTVLCIVLQAVCFFIVRCYYLLTYCSAPARQRDMGAV